MKKTTMIRMALTIVTVTMAYSMGFAQETTVTPGGLFLHGNNSLNATVSSENTDSVTVGATMQYWTQPDPALINPLNTYTWTIAPAFGTQTLGGTSNTASFKFGNTSGLDSIKVKENSTLGCVGSSRSIPVELIAAPANTAISFSVLACPTGPIPYTTLTGPTVTLTLVDAMKAGAQRIKVTYDVTGPAGFTSVLGTVANLPEGTNTISLAGITLSQPGTYTFTITALTDRISRKSGIVGTLTSATGTFVVNRAPVTGPIYHVPNM